nr:hypothetical protein GCM10020093_045610 [Planobispora longispora]
MQTAPDDTAVILYTSGTTGRPKGAELTHMNMLVNAMVSDEMYPRAEGGDAYLAVLPLFHSFGQTVVMNAGFRRRATLVLMPRFEPGPALELMRRENVTLFAGVPTMYWAMLTKIHADGDEVPTSLATAVAAAPPPRSRCSRTSRRPSASASWRATACPRPLRWPASTSWASPPSRAPSARRSGAWR